MQRVQKRDPAKKHLLDRVIRSVYYNATEDEWQDVFDLIATRLCKPDWTLQEVSSINAKASSSPLTVRAFLSEVGSKDETTQ